MASSIWKASGSCLDLGELNSDLTLIHILHHFPNCWNRATTWLQSFVPNTFNVAETHRDSSPKLRKSLDCYYKENLGNKDHSLPFSLIFTPSTTLLVVFRDLRIPSLERQESWGAAHAGLGFSAESRRFISAFIFFPLGSETCCSRF